MTLKNSKELASDFIAGQDGEVVYALLALGRTMRRDGLIRQLRIKLSQHDAAHGTTYKKTFEDRMRTAIIPSAT